MIKPIVMSVMVATLALSSACSGAKNDEKASSNANFVAGTDYTVLENPSSTNTANQIEVREFFWYGCGHCYNLEPVVQEWTKDLATDVKFVRTPAAMNPVWEKNARGYFVAEQLNLVGKTHLPLFKHIHEEGNQTFDQASLAKFYAGYGADKNEFNRLFNSFAVTEKVNESNKLAKQYQLNGVPALVVAGKYVVLGEDETALDTVDYLVEKERAAAKPATS